MKTIWALFMVFFLYWIQPVMAGSDSVAANVQELFSAVSRVSARQQDEFSLFNTPEYVAFSKFCQENVGELVAHWAAAGAGVSSQCRPWMHREYPQIETGEDWLIVALNDDYSQFSARRTFMSPNACVKNIPILLRDYAARNDATHYRDVYQATSRFWKYNYYRDDIQAILNEVTARAAALHCDDLRIESVESGKSLFDDLSFWLKPNADGTDRNPFALLVEDPEFTPELFYLLVAYAQGPVYHEPDPLPSRVLSPAELQVLADLGLHSDSRENASVPKTNPKPARKVIKRPATDRLLPPEMLIDRTRAFEALVIEYPEGEKYDDYLRFRDSYDDLLYSYSAECILLKMAQARQRSRQIRGLLIDMLWHGVYAEDQLDRFLPILLDEDENLRRRAWGAIPEFLKKDVRFSPEHLLTQQEYQALRQQVKKNADETKILLSVESDEE